MTQTSELQVGMRILHRYYGEGTIIGFSQYGSPAVRFDTPRIQFHGCNGLGDLGHCFYVNEHGVRTLSLPPEDYVPTQEGDRDNDI